MARRVFFSFHYDRDSWRAAQVRNSGAFKDIEQAGYWDHAKWEEIQKQGDQAIKNWIDENLKGSSVTVVLIGAETSKRKWVKYELQASYEKGNGMLGVYIHNIKDSKGDTDTKGDPYFGEIGKDKNGDPVYFSVNYPTYDYVNDDGNNNLGKWIETAAKEAGK